MKATDQILFIRDVRSIIEQARPRAKMDFEISSIRFEEAEDDFETAGDLEAMEDARPPQDSWHIEIVMVDGVTYQCEAPAGVFSARQLAESALRCCHNFK